MNERKCSGFQASANETPASAESDQAERRLLLRIAARDRRAMEEFYLLYYTRVQRLLRRIIWQREWIEELVNDTFMVVWKEATQFQGESRVCTWVFAIAYRCRLMAFRDESRAQSSPLHVPLLTASERGDLSLNLTSADWIDRALDRLPMEQSAALELTYGLGLSYVEISTVMRCPEDTVKARVFDACRKLRVVLDELELPTIAAPVLLETRPDIPSQRCG